jgi:brefeldin A-resistance guanine nucleotide exchange factor 1
VNGSVASCRFEAGAEVAAEEAVLMRMLQSLLTILRAPAATA